MRNLLWVFMGAVLGFAGGWHLRDLGRAPVRPSEALSFLDRFADEQVHYLSAAGTWRGADIANKINLVRILCDATTKLCEMSQADLIDLGYGPFLSLHQQTFKITHADAARISAVESSPALCIRQTLFIDRTARAVSLVRTKINGADDCSTVQDETDTISLVDGTR